MSKLEEFQQLVCRAFTETDGNELLKVTDRLVEMYRAAVCMVPVSERLPEADTDKWYLIRTDMGHYFIAQLITTIYGLNGWRAEYNTWVDDVISWRELEEGEK